MSSERRDLVRTWVVVTVMAAAGCNTFGTGSNNGADAHVTTDAGTGGAPKGGTGGGTGSASNPDAGGPKGGTGGDASNVGNPDAANGGHATGGAASGNSTGGAGEVGGTGGSSVATATGGSGNVDAAAPSGTPDVALGTDAPTGSNNSDAAIATDAPAGGDARSDAVVDVPIKTAPVCTAAAKRCTGLQPQTCDASGSAWQDTGAACPNLCDNATGTCTGTCMPNTRKCNGTQPQTCDAKGAWQNTANACSGCTTCSTTSGTCVNAANSTSCNDNNACTQGDSCQGGTCSGTTIPCPAPAACHVAGQCSGGTCTTPLAADGTADTKCPTEFQHCVGGACVQCMNDTHCSGSTPSCDTKTHKCVCRRPSPGNLVVNGGFDKDLSGWTPDPDYLFWSSEDADNCPGSGSGDARRSDSAPEQRIAINGANTYYFGARFQQPVPTSAVGCAILLTAAPGCDGPRLGDPIYIEPEKGSSAPDHGWSSYSTVIQTPANADCAILYCILDNKIDQIYLNADDNRF